MSKRIYITFDDGPLSGTKNIISTIDKLGARGACVRFSMLMVGMHIEAGAKNRSYFDMAKADSRVTIGNHSYSHANNRYRAFYENPQGVLADFERNKKIIAVDNMTARLPGRNMWQVGSRHKYDIESGQTSAQLLHKNGYSVFGWDIEWQHEPSGEPIQSVNEMVSGINNLIDNNKTFTKGTVVVLAHDQMFGNASETSQLMQLLNKLLDEGFVFEDLTTYPVQ